MTVRLTKMAQTWLKHGISCTATSSDVFILPESVIPFPQMFPLLLVSYEYLMRPTAVSERVRGSVLEKEKSGCEKEWMCIYQSVDDPR